tara:strand:- start:27409 stop:28275 length:867 start_codon:yes stop_codon:yes gene_type:complete
MRKILFPFSVGQSQFKEAFIVAVKFARTLNAELILLNAFEIELDDNITKESYNRQIKNKWIVAYNEVTAFNKYYLSKYAKVNDEMKVRFDHRFVYANESEQILNIVSKEAIDMLILPYGELKADHKKIDHLVDNDIFNNNSTSLLLIPSKFEYGSIKNIVYATDLKEHHLNKFYFNEILKYAKIFDAKIHFLHIDASGKEEKKQNNKVLKLINDIISRNSKHVYNSVNSRDINNAIINYTDANNIDLISVVKEDDRFWSVLFQKSISKKIVEVSKVPVLYMIEKTGLE